MKLQNRLTTFVDDNTLSLFKKKAVEIGHSDSSMLRYIIEKFVTPWDHEMIPNKINTHIIGDVCHKCGFKPKT